MSDAVFSEQVSKRPQLCKALDAAYEGIFIVSPQHEIIDCNRTFCSLLKKRKKEILNRKCYRILHGKSRRIKQCLLRRARREGRKLEFELKEPYLGKYLYLSANCYFDKQGRFIYGVHVIKDISERKRTEMMKDNLIRNVSHELKTPVAMVEMASDMCKRGIEDNDMLRISKAQRIISENLERLHRDVGRILDLSALGKRQAAKKEKTSSLQKIIDEIAENVKGLINSKKLKMSVNIPARADKVLADEKHIHSLLYNLVDNAIKFTEQGGIFLTAGLKGKYIRISLKDTGCGIPTGDINKVFERFRQRHAAVPGTGLGLSICKEIAKMYDGEIKVISRGIGKGTTVIVNLPKG